jgi:MOSC domain-containing protein YiiM
MTAAGIREIARAAGTVPAGRVEAIFVVPERRAAPIALPEVEALAEIGLRGDRWGEARPKGLPRRCQVTLIEAEHLERAGATFAEAMARGEHRRNIVTRGIRLAELEGKRFRVGGALMIYDRRRAPCAHLDASAGAGAARELGGWGGICARVLEGGLIRLGDPVVMVDPEVPD